MGTNMGVPASPSGSSAEPGPISVVPAVPVSIPNAAIFARASELADARYPNGANATQLADILREAIRELRPTAQRAHPLSGQRSNRSNNLSRLSPEHRAEARRVCAETTYAMAPGAAPCTDRGFVCYRCQDMAASAIEARRAATENTGAVHESAVAASETPNLSPQGHSHE